MPVTVKSDVVTTESSENVLSSPRLQNASLFADQFKGSANAPSAQHFTQPQSGFVISGKKEILGIKPENHPHFSRRCPSPALAPKEESDGEKKNQPGKMNSARGP